MALPETTYALYTQSGGTASEETFDACIRDALACVHDIIGFNEPGDDDQERAYHRAVAAAVDAIALTGGTSGIGSASIGSFSYTADGERAGGYIVSQVRGQLVGTGLLCQVIL